MNLAHVHLLLNHFPTIGMIVGLGVFFVALIAKSDDLKRASLLVFFALSLVSIPTFVTGTAAELTLQNTPDVSKSVIETHETAAFIALSFMELLGALGWLGLWQYRRLSRFPQGTIAATMLVGLVTLGLMTRAANLGGQIRHPEIGAGPSVVKAADGAQETTEPNPPLARIIGDAM